MTPIPPACPFEALFCEPCANAEIAELRRRCDNLRETRDELAAENARLGALLRQLIRIEDYAIEYSNTSLVNFTETLAYVGRVPMRDLIADVRKELEGER